MQRTFGGSRRPGHSGDNKQTENSGSALRPRVGDKSASQQGWDCRGLEALVSENIQNIKISASGPREIDGETNRNSERLNFGGLQNHCRW